MTPLETIVRHVLERAAETIKANEVLHGSSADELRARSDGNLSGLAYATYILALPIDQIATEVEALLPGYQMLPQAAETGSSRPDDASASREGGHGAADAPSQPDQAKVAALVRACDRYNFADDNYDEKDDAAMREWRAARLQMRAALANLETTP